MEIRCVYTEGNQNVIQEAVDRLPASGGTVIVPRGEWKSGAIHLKSNVKLYLEEGCVIHFSSCMEDYLPPVFTRWEGVECYNYSSLIYAADCENVTICGTGVLDGAGSAWWHWKKLQQNAADRLIRAESQGIVVEERVFATREDALRPSFIQFINCKHVTLEDFTIEDGPQWTIHPVYCEDVVVRGVTVNTKGPNTDGCNPDSCRKVLIEDCTFDTGDDCIAINSGMNEDGWRVGRPCEQIEVKNCRFIGGHAAVAIGSGMSGGICDIWIHDCVVRGTERGIRIKSMRGRGGYVKRINVQRMQMDEIEKEDRSEHELWFQHGDAGVAEGAGIFGDPFCPYKGKPCSRRCLALRTAGKSAAKTYPGRRIDRCRRPAEGRVCGKVKYFFSGALVLMNA